MAINQNHLFEELGGVKCAIVEKNVSRERTDFLERILAYNHYEVIIVASPPLKAAPAKPAEAATETVAPAAQTTETFTVGVTDVMFNPINAIFGRLLKSPGGHIITLAYWQQRETYPHDEIPYFDTQSPKA